jgi:NAD(P)-dependent dehydrogenase (short-subunit alcohol dehydrogenase family)
MSRRILITAAAAGIGAAIALRAAAQGYEVIVSDINDELGHPLARDNGFRYIHCDLASEAQIVALVKEAGTVDVLVNNGGTSGPTRPVSEISLAEWQAVFDVNLTAQFLACREMVPRMRAAGGGCIINMSSVAGRIGYPKRSPYSASKWGVLGLTASLAQELAKDRIRVNAVLPGAVRGARITDVIARHAAANSISPQESEAQYLSRQATGRFVEPTEIAAAVLYLASEVAASVTGQFLGIDGGWM